MPPADLRSTHEHDFVRAFIQKERQDRCLHLLTNPKRRRRFTDELAHFKWLDDRYSQLIPPSIARTADEMVSLLRAKGCGKSVWIISEDHELDATELQLVEAMKRVWGSSMSTVLSCIPGKLAFFHGEEMKSERLLERRW